MGVEDLAVLGLAAAVGMHYFSKTTTKNAGKLVKKAEVDAVVDKTDLPDGGAEYYAPVEDIKGRDANVTCSVPPPQMLSTSLLPAKAEAMTDADFNGITPEKLEKINFLSAAWALGRDTQSNTMRNASHDLRSEPVNPHSLNLKNNSFLNSTITHPEFMRSFEPDPVSESDMATPEEPVAA